MADGKQTQQTGEKQQQAAPVLSARREELLKRVRQQILDAKDVNSDNSVDAKDSEIKNAAIEFISTECLSLPEARLIKLLEAIELRMQQKEAYKQNLLDECRREREKIMAGTSHARKFGVDKFTLMDKLGMDPELFRGNLNPKEINVQKGSDTLQKLAFLPDGEEKIRKLITQKDDRIAGFLAYWTDQHPVYVELKKRGATEAIAVMDKIESPLRTKFKFDRNAAQLYQSLNSNPYEYAKNYVTMYNGEKGKIETALNKAGNRALDFVEYNAPRFSKDWNDSLKMERKIFIYQFASSPGGMEPEELANYVDKSASYLEYAMTDEKGRKAFLSEFDKDSSKRKFCAFIGNWHEYNSIYNTLKVRGRADILLEISKVRSELLKRYNITEEEAKGLRSYDVQELLVKKDIGANPSQKGKPNTNETKSEKEKRKQEFVDGVEKRANTYEKTILVSFGIIGDGLRKRDAKTIEDAKATLARLSTGPLSEMLSNAEEFFPTKPGSEPHPTTKKIIGLKLAIEVMRDIYINEVVGADSLRNKFAAFVTSSWNNTLISTKQDQINAILAGNHDVLMTFRTENKGFTRVYGITSASDFDKKLQGKKNEFLDPSNINPEAFVGTIVTEYVSGRLTLENLEKRWGKERVMELALLWGGEAAMNEKDQVLLENIERRFVDNGRGKVRDALVSVLDEALSTKEQRAKTIDGFKSLKNVDSMVSILKEKYPKMNESAFRAAVLEIKESISKPDGFRYGSSIMKIMRTLGLDKIDQKQQSEINEVISKAFDSVHAEYAEYKDYREYKDKPINSLQIVKKDLSALPNKTKDEERILGLSLPINELNAQDGEIFINMLKRGGLEKTQCHKYALETLSFCSVKDNQSAFEFGKKSGDSYVKAINVARAAEKAGDTPVLGEAITKINTFDKTNLSAGKVANSAKSSAVYAEATESENRNTLKKIGFGSHSPDEIFSNPELRAKVKEALEKNGEEGSSLYALIKAHDKNVEDWKRTSAVYEKTFGRRLEMPEIELSGKDAKSSKYLRALNESFAPSAIAAERSSESRRLASLSDQSISATRAYDISKPGETVQISSSVSATKTESGGLVVDTPTGKLKFDYKEAKGAMNEIDILERAGAAFLIPAMKEIAANTGIQLKNGISREEANKMLSNLAKAFGMNDIANETDPRALLEKFKTAASGSLGGGDLSERARKLGFVDDMGTLKPEKLAKGLEKYAEIEKPKMKS